MREVSHFLLELKNGSESRGDVVCGIPHSAPENEVGAGSDLDPPPSGLPISLDPLQSASPDTKVGDNTFYKRRTAVIDGILRASFSLGFILLVTSLLHAECFGSARYISYAGMCGCSIYQTLLHRCIRPPKLIFLTPLTSRLVFRGVGNFCLTRPWKRSRLPKTRPRKATGCSWQGAFTRPRYTWKSSAPSTLSAQVLVCSRLANFSACGSGSWLSCGKDQSCRAQTPLLRGSWLKTACPQHKASNLACVLLPAGVGSLAWCP